jgi:hypothetical protein
MELILTALRVLAGVIPTLVADGKGDKVSGLLNTLATLGERGEEAYEELKALTEKLKQMDGVTPEDRASLWETIEAQHAAIQAPG